MKLDLRSISHKTKIVLISALKLFCFICNFDIYFADLYGSHFLPICNTNRNCVC